MKEEGLRLGIRMKFLSEALEQAAQRSCGCSVPEAFKAGLDGALSSLG